MKRLITLAIAIFAASFAFGQTTNDYKHPLAKQKNKEGEKFSTETVIESQDYKHPRKKAVKRVRVRQGEPAADYKHPLR